MRPATTFSNIQLSNSRAPKGIDLESMDTLVDPTLEMYYNKL